jgi:cytochrome c553
MKRTFAVLFFSAIVFGAQAQQPAGDPKEAHKKIAMCEGCHGIPGYRTAYPEVYQVPMLGGQQAAYLAAALTAYKKGERSHPSMRGIAASLSEKDILDLAAYYAGGHK